MVADLVAYTVVAAFALVNGVNDGGMIVALGLRTAAARPWLRVVVLVVLFVATPLVLGTEVAATLAERLVSFEAGGGRTPVLAAVIATMLVVWLLAARGVPTSLTLGLVGALAGAGLGAGLPVLWRALAVVLLVAALAPLVGLAAAMLLHRVLVPLIGAVTTLRRLVPPLGHALQCVAYGGNDGQKMLAVAAVTAGTGATTGQIPNGLLALVVAAFLLGTVIGVARIGPTVSGRVLPARVEHAALAQLTGAGAVLGSAAFASPVSLVQATTGGLVGAGVGVTARRVRWAVVGQIVTAWIVTLPASFAVGAALAAVVEVLT